MTNTNQINSNFNYIKISKTTSFKFPLKVESMRGLKNDLLITRESIRVYRNHQSIKTSKSTLFLEKRIS